jgi:arylamine N-acetyltransferase
MTSEGVATRTVDGPVDEADLAGYLARIRYTGPTDATLETLRAVVAAHGNHIPFENLDPLMGIPVEDLTGPGLMDKMVRRHRGGYCFEQNNLMRYVLTALGFDVEPLTGRVVWMDPAGLDGPPHPLTHLVLAVGIPGVDERHLVDVGFGGQTLTSPIRLVAEEVQATRHEPYRLRVFADGYVLEASIRDEWRPLYTFTEAPRPMIDLQVGSWYVSTHPSSFFVTGLSAALVTDDARWNLRGRNLTIHHTGGPSEQIRFDNASQVLDALINRFGIDIDGLGDVPTRIGEVLDS